VENRYEELVELDRSLAGILMPVDILLVSEAEFEERAEQPGTVERAACKEGRGRAAYPTETSNWVT
jgi:hypothetical protein